MGLTVAVDVVVVLWLLHRQRRVRRVHPRLGLRLAILFAVIGFIELLDYTDTHRLDLPEAGVLTGSFLVAAIGLGILRAMSVQIWQDGNAVYRQGNWWTVGLLLLALGLHYGAEGGIDALGGPGGVGTASLLLWLGVTYGVQRAVVHRRAAPLLQAAASAGGPSVIINGWSVGFRTGTPPPPSPRGRWSGGHPQEDRVTGSGRSGRFSRFGGPVGYARPGQSGQTGGFGGFGGIGGIGGQSGSGGLGGLGRRFKGAPPPSPSHPDAIDVDAEPRDQAPDRPPPEDG